MNTISNLETKLKTDTHLLPKSLKEDKSKAQIMIYAFNFAASSNNYPIKENRTPQNMTKEVDISELYEMYNYIMRQALQLGCLDFAEFMNKELDEAYIRLEKAGIIK